MTPAGLPADASHSREIPAPAEPPAWPADSDSHLGALAVNTASHEPPRPPRNWEIKHWCLKPPSLGWFAAP